MGDRRPVAERWLRHVTMTDADSGRGNARTDPDESHAIPRLAAMTAFRRDVLWVLSHAGPLKQSSVERSLESYYGEPVESDRVAASLADLAELGLVDVDAREERAGEYRLTTPGRRALSGRRVWIDVGDS